MKERNEHERMLAEALRQIAVFVDGNFEYVGWARQAFPASREAIDRLRPESLRTAFSYHPSAFATLMGVAVATHVHLHQLWMLRDEMMGPVSFLPPASLN